MHDVAAEPNLARGAGEGGEAGAEEKEMAVWAGEEEKDGRPWKTTATGQCGDTKYGQSRCAERRRRSAAGAGKQRRLEGDGGVDRGRKQRRPSWRPNALF